MYTLQLLVLPVLAATFQNPLQSNTDVVDKEMISTIMRDVLGAKCMPTFSEALRIQVA